MAIALSITARVEEDDGGVGFPAGEPAQLSATVLENGWRVDRHYPAVDGQLAGAKDERAFTPIGDVFDKHPAGV